MRKTSIVSINPKYKEDNDENIRERERDYNIKHMCAYKSLYSKNGIYNYERGATTIHPRRRYK